MVPAMAIHSKDFKIFIFIPPLFFSYKSLAFAFQAKAD